MSASTQLRSVRLACVAVLDRSHAPLYIKCFVNNPGELEFHYIVNGSLDVFEERAEMGRAGDPFLGMVHATVDFKVFGFAGNSGVKLVGIFYDDLPSTSELLPFFQQLHQLVIDSTCNPFYKPGTRITSARFESAISRLMEQLR